MFIRMRKSYSRLYCSLVQAMLNQTAVNDLKGLSFPLDFYLSRNKPGEI